MCLFSRNLIMKIFCGLMTAMIVYSSSAIKANAEESQVKAQPVMTMTVLPFKVRSKGDDKDIGTMFGQLLLAELSTKYDADRIVDREDLDMVLGELELSESGLVAKDQMLRIGQLAGAKLLITGSIFKMDGKIIVAAKIIGSETSKTIGVAYKGDGEFDDLVIPLVTQIEKVINEKGAGLMPVLSDPPAAALRIKEYFRKLNIPLNKKVCVKIKEDIVNNNVADPAAQTALLQMLREAGFELTEDKTAADIVFSGEGIAELSGKHNNLFSATARLELKMYYNDKLVGVMAQREVMASTAPNIAAKSAFAILGTNLGEKLLVTNAKELGASK